jgi:hypothetical protein
MNFSELVLPSNRKFGYFFSTVFFVVSAYFYLKECTNTSYLFAVLSLLFLMTTVIKAETLLPLNKLWMHFGLLLGMIVSPIVLGFIFFGIFAPISIVTRLFGRDELRLRYKKKISHWVPRESSSLQFDAFKYQF